MSPRWLKVPLWMIAIGIIVAALLGYVALARFVAQQLVLTGIVVLLTWLGYLAIRAFTREPRRTQSRPSATCSSSASDSTQPRRRQLRAPDRARPDLRARSSARCRS